jgi:isoquinoline 1-oxidoreductase alpha subunit
MQLTINGKAIDFVADPDMPLLWALRDLAGILGPKFGCGIGACGACTVLVEGAPTRSCSIPIAAVKGAVTTIEGLSKDGTLSSVQQAWFEAQVPQCGYCQAGQIMSAHALLEKIPDPSDGDIDDAMAGNVCRCGTYPRIRAAIKKAAALRRART